VATAGKYQAIFRVTTDNVTLGVVTEADLRLPLEKKE